MEWWLVLRVFLNLLFPFFSLPLQGVQRNTTLSFYHTIWRSMFQIRITESCVCLIVTGVMETDRQITNLQDAWCRSEQTQETCIQCSGQLDGHHMLPNLLWQWFAKQMKSNTCKTLSLEQRERGRAARKHTKKKLTLISRLSWIALLSTVILFSLVNALPSMTIPNTGIEGVLRLHALQSLSRIINLSHSSDWKQNALLVVYYDAFFLNDHNVQQFNHQGPDTST